MILVGVSNILGIMQDNASPFNIADSLDVEYFSKKEVFELLGQHEQATGQLFERKMKEKIFSITAGQPGLVNGFAGQLVVNTFVKKQQFEYTDYLQIEDWYLNQAIYKNVANILNKAQQFRPFVEGLLYTDRKIPFQIDREAIKFLHIHGLLKQDAA